jgi:hypothetical protein
MARTMPKIVGILALALLVVGRPAVGRAHLSPGEEFGLALASAASNLLYIPAKVAVAAVGLPIGAATGILSGGDVRAAYAVWVPAASGTYFLRPAHLEGTEPIDFFGSDYADRPSRGSAALEAGSIYEAQYSQ